MSGECDRCGNHYLECMCDWRESEVGREVVELEVMEADDEGWSEWIHPLPGYQMKCCDCGLIHLMEVAIGETATTDGARNDGETEDRVVLFRMKRAG